MDKRKNQILKKVDEITEEKNLLQSNLDKIIKQVSTCVDAVNKSKKLKQKDCSLILKYELEILKKITEINYELECVIEESPLSQLEMNGVLEDYSEIIVKPENSAPSFIKPIIVEKQETAELDQEIQLNDVACASIYFPSEKSNVDIEETQSTLSDAEMQVLRGTLKKFSEKFGLNSACISSMADFYQKSSSNNILEVSEKPSTSQNSLYKVDNTNLGLDLEKDLDVFEVPEKDTNKIVSSEIELKQNDVDVFQNVEPLISLDVMDTATSSSSFHTVCDRNLVENIPEATLLESEPQRMDTVDESSSSDTNLSESSSNISANQCLIPLVDEDSIIIGNIIDEGPFETENNTNRLNEAVFTAIEKLNNTKFLDRKAEAVAKMQPVDQPDIKLMPTEHRIKNDFEANNKQPKKKKNKKNKCKENEIYELVPKCPPDLGMDCAFSHVESPNEFYIHIVDEESFQIDGLTEQLNVKFNGSVSPFSSKEEAVTAIGNFCICYVLSYNSWYRAHVLDWELGSKLDDVVVQFVDYGDKRRTSYKNLRGLTKEVADIPMLAVRCHLALMYPPQSTRSNRLTEWPSATIDAMMELSGLAPHTQVNKLFKIVYANQEGDSVAIDMYNLKEKSEEQTVGQILLDWQLATQITEEEEDDENYSDLEAFLQDIDSLETADNINEAVMGYDPRDEARICRFTKSDGTCYKGKNCKLDHVPLSKDGFTTDNDLVFKEAMYSLTLPATGQLVYILITGYKDVCNFFAQIVWHPHNEKDYMIDEDLYALLADMNVTKTVQTYETFKVPPAIGEIVILKHWSNKWLRAVVREEITSNNDIVEYQVFTLDFGEYLRVSLNDLRKIKPHFLKLPFQVVECYLDQYETREDCDEKKAKKFFSQAMYYHNFVALTVSSFLPLKLTVTTFDSKDIGRRLFDEGFAKKRGNDSNPADSCCLELY